jgi:hypothetical protein
MRQTIGFALVGAVVVLPSHVRALASITDVGPTAADIQDTDAVGGLLSLDRNNPTYAESNRRMPNSAHANDR